MSKVFVRDFIKIPWIYCTYFVKRDKFKSASDFGESFLGNFSPRVSSSSFLLSMKDRRWRFPLNNIIYWRIFYEVIYSSLRHLQYYISSEFFFLSFLFFLRMKCKIQLIFVYWNVWDERLKFMCLDIRCWLRRFYVYTGISRFQLF